MDDVCGPMENGKYTEQQELDPADYLFQTKKYHDRHITVGGPDSDRVEIIGVSTPHLASQSTVFREMLEESKLADRTGKNTHVTDVSPEVFKLMLRHIYGGKLPSDISRETAASLALCADKYNIEPLVARATTMLVPITSVQQVFVALRIVFYIKAPELETHVVTFIQEHTDEIIANEEFLLSDPNFLNLIAKQEKLTVSELNLWKSLLKWAKSRTDDPAEMRQLLNKTLKHVRFLSMSKDEFIEEVMPSNVLSSEESVGLLMAIIGKKTPEIAGMCTVQQKRAKKKSPAKSVEVVPKKKKRNTNNFDFDSK